MHLVDDGVNMSYEEYMRIPPQTSGMSCLVSFSFFLFDLCVLSQC